MHILKHNEVILIGNHKLVFDCSDHLMATSKVRNDYDVGKTLLLNVRSYHDLNKKITDGPSVKDLSENDSKGKKANQPSFFSRLLKLIFR
jgi:hypothetical protein